MTRLLKRHVEIATIIFGGIVTILLVGMAFLIDFHLRTAAFLIAASTILMTLPPIYYHVSFHRYERFALGRAPIYVTIGLTLILIGLSAVSVLQTPATHVPETLLSGPLLPGNDSTPDNACSKFANGRVPVPPESYLTVLFGSSAIVRPGTGHFPVLQVGNCPLLSLDWIDDEVTVDATVYDEKGGVTARVRKGQVEVLTGDQVSATRGDLSTLTVLGKQQKELLYIRFMNPHTVRIRGLFMCPGHGQITIDDTHLGGLPLTNFCRWGKALALQQDGEYLYVR